MVTYSAAQISNRGLGQSPIFKKLRIELTDVAQIYIEFIAGTNIFFSRGEFF